MHAGYLLEMMYHVADIIFECIVQRYGLSIHDYLV